MNYKLTSSQQTFNTEMITGDLPVWNNLLYVMFDCDITLDEFSNILNDIFKENSMLMTSFIKNNLGQIEQCINDYSPQVFEQLEFNSIDELEDFSKREVNTPTLICENSFKVYIFKLGSKCGCIFRIHHILFDGFCENLIIEILKSKLNLTSTKINTSDYKQLFDNNEKYLNSVRYSKSIEYWKKEINSNFSSSIYSFKSSDDYSAAELWFQFDNEKIETAKQICENSNVPFSAFLYALFAVYVNNCIGIRDFSVGMPIVNRMNAEEMQTLGLFMHILPLIIHIDENSTFISLVEDVYDRILELSKHQKFTIYDINQNINNDKINGQFFDVVVNYFSENISNCEYNSFRSDYSTMPLDLRFCENNNAFSVLFRYRNKYFLKKDIEEIFISFESILNTFIDNPNVYIKDISINLKSEIDGFDSELILNKFNATKHGFLIDKSSTLYSLFERTACDYSDDICITANEKKLSFKELLNISSSLDCEIRSFTKEKSIVAVIADRSIEMYSAIYGIIRGGNAYLPIDPNHPTERIEYILENSGAELVVAQGQYTHLAGKTPCIDMTSFLENTPVFDVVPPCNATEDDTAYVIYTSGSTGQPKGAKISHKSAVNRIAWMHDFYPLEKNDVILQKTPYTFDVSVWEIFWWGMFGGKLVASKPNEHFVPEKILEEVENNRVTHLHFVPSVFDVFLSHLEKNIDDVSKFNSVKHVFLSGEALTSNLIKRFYNLFDYKNVKLHNLYGPTECAVDVTYYDCSPNDVDPVPIGKPIYNTQMYVLDDNLKPLPIGVTGELHIGGVNVGQGYLNNEELTNEKFVDNPFGEGKLYKTGDLAYWREDGNIIYVGRNDFQVKVRGLRIELGEIENAINSIENITNSVVIFKRNPDKLIAFYTGREVDEKTIRDTLKLQLPMYMLPNSFIYINEIPLTTSGKIDRDKLLSIDIDNAEKTISDELIPKTELEKYACNLFNEILSVENTNLESDFYELGGTSLDVIKLLSNVKFSSVKIADFMLNPTPSGLINLIEQNTMQFKFLDALYLPTDAKKVLVMFPFAGGNASGYFALVNEFKKSNSDIALYYVDWCKNETEYNSIAKEIETLSKAYEINFYSHCAGSVIAMKLLDMLPQNCVNKYIAGASLPEKSFVPFNIWSIFSDKAIIKYLYKAGFKSDLIDDFVLEKMIAQFRVNTKEYQIYFNNKMELTNANVISVVSKSDPFTKKYKKSNIIWNSIASCYKETIYIESNSHYFQSDNAKDLLDIIIKSLTEDE